LSRPDDFIVIALIALNYLQLNWNDEFFKGCWNSTENKSGEIPVPVSAEMAGEDLYPALMRINEDVNLFADFQVEKSGGGT
jgi:hypothetical protein